MTSILMEFGQTASEVTACGRPVVAFNIGGLPDIVDHKENGYLAEPYSPEDLAQGINWVLDNDTRNVKLSKQAREKAEKQFDIRVVAKHYVELYSNILNG